MTHFILLLYEIAAGEPRGLSLWSQHISQLLRIILLRREMYENEPYGFIIWWVASIDTHVVLSGMGNGEFVEQMLRHNLLPTGIGSDAHYHPSRRPLSPDPHQALPSALSFHRRISILAAQLGLLARDLRKEAKKYNNFPSVAVVRGWTERICVLQDTLRRAWNVQMPASIASGYCNQILPVGARGIFEHVSPLPCPCDQAQTKHPQVLRTLPRPHNLLSHLHVPHPTLPQPLPLHTRSIPMRRRNPPPRPRNRVHSALGAQIRRLPPLHVGFRLEVS